MILTVSPLYYVPLYWRAIYYLTITFCQKVIKRDVCLYRQVMVPEDCVLTLWKAIQRFLINIIFHCFTL